MLGELSEAALGVRWRAGWLVGRGRQAVFESDVGEVGRAIFRGQIMGFGPLDWGWGPSSHMCAEGAAFFQRSVERGRLRGRCG